MEIKKPVKHRARRPKATANPAVAYLFLFAMAICVYFLLGGFTFWYVNIKLMGAFFFDTSLASIFGVNLVGWTIWYTRSFD